MNKLANVLAQTMANAQKANPQKPEDYTGEDGLLYCGVCRQCKQSRMELFDGEWFAVPVMCQCRQEQVKREEEEAKRNEAMIKISRLQSIFPIPDDLRNACFKNYEQKQHNAKAYKIARNYVKNFEEMYANKQGLLFFGTVGTGKSWTAACIMHALIAQYVPVAMTSLSRIISMIQDRTSTEEEILRLFRKAKLLILDDLGAERETSFALEKVYNVIDGRIQSGKPMILTTNLTFDELTKPQDIRYKRIYDRILKVCYPVSISGFSFRRQEANKRISAMEALLTGGNE